MLEFNKDVQNCLTAFDVLLSFVDVVLQVGFLILFLIGFTSDVSAFLKAAGLIFGRTGSGMFRRSLDIKQPFIGWLGVDEEFTKAPSIRSVLDVVQ